MSSVSVQVQRWVGTFPFGAANARPGRTEQPRGLPPLSRFCHPGPAPASQPPPCTPTLAPQSLPNCGLKGLNIPGRFRRGLAPRRRWVLTTVILLVRKSVKLETGLWAGKACSHQGRAELPQQPGLWETRRQLGALSSQRQRGGSWASGVQLAAWRCMDGAADSEATTTGPDSGVGSDVLKLMGQTEPNNSRAGSRAKYLRTCGREGIACMRGSFPEAPR